MPFDLMPRATVADIVRQRNQALALFAEAHEALTRAHDAKVAAFRASAAAAPGVNRYNHHQDKAKAYFLSGLDVPKREDYLALARKITDTDIWARIVQMTDLERLMDKKAKDELHRSLMDDPPEVTEDNIRATVEGFMVDAGMIFKRGIAECFSSLDRRFRSHDGWKIGSRVVLSYAFDSVSGSWNYHSNQRDTLHDIERAFMVMDEKDVPPLHVGIVAAVERSRGHGYNPRQSEVRTDYFTVRGFKNGNMHVWFNRDDLLVKVNKLLGEYYGEAIPEEREPDPDTDLFTPKTTPAKHYGFYPSPEGVAERVIREAQLYQPRDEPPLRVLEPSAGTGNLARRAVKEGTQVTCVEIQPQLAAALAATGLYRQVYAADFLMMQPDPASLYDRVVMNPPFDRERDIDHVLHALRFLKPGGLLVAVMSAGTEFRETRKSIAFRELMQTHRAEWHDLPSGSFSSVGTYVNTVTLTVRAPR